MDRILMKTDIENDWDLNHLSARQLRSRAEVIIEYFTEEDSFEPAGAEPPEKKSKKKPRQTKYSPIVLSISQSWT